VAVKTVKEGASSREKEDLLRELEIMQQLGSHANVVTLLGCCTEKGKIFVLFCYAWGRNTGVVDVSNSEPYFHIILLPN
jgi:serine/threonine protein kinase